MRQTYPQYPQQQQQYLQGQVPVYMQQQPVPPVVPPVSQGRMMHQASGRDEIIMASDDRIMTLRLAQPG